jgi:tetratricopeptide (TPR) repeat protein
MARLHRKDYKRDELVSTLESLTVAAEHHMRSLILAGAAALVLIVAVVGGIWYSRSQAADAARELGQLQKAVDAPVAAAGVVGSPSYATPQARAEEILRRADVLIADHPSSRQARWASFWKAVAQKDLGRYDEALSGLTPLAGLTDEPFLSALARMQQAQVSEKKGDLAAAAESYASLASSAPARFPAEMALMNQARLLEAQGKGEEARAIYRRITQEYPDSPYASAAGRHLTPSS